jgi:hypothetical protein
MDPLKYINKMIEMYEGPRITAQEPRIGLQGGQLVQPGVGRQGFKGERNVGSGQFTEKRRKLTKFLKNKKSVTSTELTEFLTKLGYKDPSAVLWDTRQRDWFKALDVEYIQDPNPMLTGEKKGRVNIPKARKTVYNKYAALFHKEQPKEYLSSNWDDLTYDQRQEISSIAKNNDYKFKVKYSRQRRFKSTKEKKLMEVFGLTEQNFLDHGKHGVERTLASGKTNPEYTKIHNYVQNDFKFLKKDVLDVATQRKIMNNFELPEGITEWKFNEYKYGIADTSGKNMNLGKRIANKLKEKTWRVAADTSSPQGWMMYQMTRAFDNDMRLPNGQLAYEPKYETINGKKRIVGFTDNTTYGKGQTYYGLKKWAKKYKGDDWASHADFKKTSKFVDIAKKAYAQPNEVITGLLKKGGIPRNGRLQLNHVLKFLAQQEGYDITRIKNAIVKHHMGGVGARKMIGSPTNDLQILKFTVNNEIRQIENNIRKGIYLKDDITALKNYGASVRGPDGRLYGGGSRTAIGGFKAIEKGAEQAIKKWKPEDFNKFQKWVKKFPCMKSDGGTPDIACHLKGMKHEKNLLAEGKGTRAMADKFLDGTKLARKGGALKTVLGVGGILGDVLFEGAYAAYNYTQGMDAAEIWRHSWYSFMDPSMWKDGKYIGWVADEEKRKQYEIKDEEGNVTGIRKNVKRYLDNADKVEQQLNLFDNITKAETMDTRGYDRTTAVANAKKALSDFHASLGPPGGMERLYKELEYDRPYVDARQEAVGAEKIKKKVATFEKMKEEGKFPEDMEYADRFDKPSHYKKRYDDFIDFRTTVFDRPTKPSFYLPKGKLEQRVEDPRHGVPYATRGGPEAQADITGETIENYLRVKAMEAGEPITQDEAVKLKWKLIYEGGGIDLQDKIGIAGGVSKMAEGGLTRTVARDSGPMQGLASTPEYATYRKEYKWQT